MKRAGLDRASQDVSLNREKHYTAFALKTTETVCFFHILAWELIAQGYYAEGRATKKGVSVGDP